MGILFSAASCLATEAACCFSSATRIAYAVLFLTNSLLAWLMMSDLAMAKLDTLSKGYLKLACKQCYGVLAVQRVAFALTMFHLILAAVMVGIRSSSNPRSGIQNGYWSLKIISWLLLLVAAAFIPNEFFIAYARYVAICGAALFVLLQLLLLIDFAHSFSERLIENHEMSSEKAPLILLVVTTLGLLILTIVLTGIMYGLFATRDCQLNQFFVSFNLILCFISIILAIAPQVQEQNSRSGLTQAAIVTAYATYLVMSAVANEPIDNIHPQCTPLGSSKSSQTLTVVLGAMFTFIAVVYSTSRAAVQGVSIIGQSDSTTIHHDEESSVPLIGNQPHSNTTTLQAAVESGAIPSSALNGFGQTSTTAGPSDLYPTDDEIDIVAYNYSFFHIIFALASMYIAMLLTNWSTVNVTPQQPTNHEGLLAEVGKSWAAVWVKVISSWVVIVLYGWTLLAPVLMPDREWQ